MDITEEIKSVTKVCEDLNSKVWSLEFERNAMLNDIRIQKSIDKAVSIVNVLTFIALYEITKKAFNKWIW